MNSKYYLDNLLCILRDLVLKRLKDNEVVNNVKPTSARIPRIKIIVVCSAIILYALNTDKVKITKIDNNLIEIIVQVFALTKRNVLLAECNSL